MVADDQMVVSRLAWEMAQFELHYLRTAFGALCAEAQQDARHAKVMRQQYLASLSRAMRDERYRRSALNALETLDGFEGAGLGVGCPLERPGESA